MSRAILCGLFLLAVSAIGRAEDPPNKLGKNITVPDNTGFTAPVSQDQQAVTITFDDAWVELGAATAGARSVYGQTAIQTKRITLNLPYTSTARSTTANLDIRGLVDLDAEATARLILCVGDVTQAIDLKPAKEKVKYKGNSQAIKDERKDRSVNDYEQRVKFTVQNRAAKPVIQITVLMVIEHDTDKNGAGLLTVDSIDLEFAKGDAATPKK